MTNTWTDIGTSDVIMVIGGNPAENHPMAFKHIQRALDNYWGNTGIPDPPTPTGAKLIVVDPRYTKTASKASSYNGRQMYTKMRSGSDIAFINGMIWYVMSNNLYNREYVLSYSNAGFLVNENFKKPGDFGQDGKFSGFTISANYPGLGDTGYYGDKIKEPSWEYCKYPALHPQEYKGVNIATDFWVLDVPPGVNPQAGNCICHPDGSCGFTKDTLSLDPADPFYIGNFRTHLIACGQLADITNAEDQKTVWEHMQEHYSLYDKNTVLGITGSDSTVYDDICDLYSKTGQHGKVGTILYAMGTTQHTVGTQNIRAYSSLQILLGNMGLSGGGINAQRGESNVQGSTDHCLLFHILPGYIKMPDSTIAGGGDKWFDRTNTIDGNTPDLLPTDPGYPGAGAKGDGTPGHTLQASSYVKRNTPFQLHQNELNWWGYWVTGGVGRSNFKRYITSLMKCYWWDSLGSPGPTNPATAAQLQAVYDWIPKLPGNCSHIQLFEDMHPDAGEKPNNKIKGLLCFGQNPAVAGPNSFRERTALNNLDWLVVSELWETETAAFWKFNTDGTPRADGGLGQSTDVFLLPAAAFYEKEGSITNSSRWAQYRYKAAPPPGDARHEIWILNAIYEEILNQGLCGTKVQQLTMGTWWYKGRCGQPIVDGYADPSPDFLDAEINGFNAAAGYPTTPLTPANQIASFTALKDDGTTSAGNWLYTNMYTGGVNKSKKRDNSNPAGIAPIYPNWAWDWPVNRRIIYNGASLVPCGWGGVTSTSWNVNHPVLKWAWTGTAWAWTGDVNDAVANPHDAPAGGHTERSPFIMEPEGHCRLHGFGLANVKDGPYPTHYEPLDTPYKGLGNPMGYSQVINPAIVIYVPGQIGDPSEYPIIATSYRVTEHWQAGAATRNLPYQCQLMPECFCEMSKALASSNGINNGDAVIITTARGSMEAKACVTDRFKTYNLAGIGPIDHIGVIWHFGYMGFCTGHSANRLTPHVGDANTRIPEYKAFLCNIAKKT
jgi:anaerobic selenocysteine-containing dehydrogenase